MTLTLLFFSNLFTKNSDLKRFDFSPCNLKSVSQNNYTDFEAEYVCDLCTEHYSSLLAESRHDILACCHWSSVAYSCCEAGIFFSMSKCWTEEPVLTCFESTQALASLFIPICSFLLVSSLSLSLSLSLVSSYRESSEPLCCRTFVRDWAKLFISCQTIRYSE